VITLVLGGARSGKSAVAEELASALPAPVTYVATMDPRGDPDLEARVAAHRARRDRNWQTKEAGDHLAEMLASLSGTVLVDSLGPWVASAGMGLGTAPGTAPGTGLGTTGIDVGALCDALQARTGDTVVVSDEVGLAVHPSSKEGRIFRDALGTVNRAVSAIADAAYLVVAGRALALPPPGLSPEVLT
jgi:nicotinate-nucleotide--dimethylbenzimidazole phosphoribosyltransferase